MSYELKAVVAEGGLLAAATLDLPRARIVGLRHGLALMPMTDSLLAELVDESKTRSTDFWALPAGCDELLAAWSKAGPVAYTESEYFGGVGEENAGVWRDGAMALGPIHLVEGEAVPAAGTPVCQALRELGVRASETEDEFTAMSLGAHRDSVGWLS